ncbi:MAG: hypothetical protein IJ019_04665 [Alphaproteobacteria bacterium]|nr:hypothetical protein [Alphaproteobacteria bacterium]
MDSTKNDINSAVSVWFEPVIEGQMIKQNLLLDSDNCLYATKEGFLLLNKIIEDLCC